MENDIIINGIETNNLKNINIIIKKNALNLIIGSSGSGKSSLAYDTIAQIGLHEYMSMFNDDIYEVTYKVSKYNNMSAVVPIRQNNCNRNIRSTIGTYFGLNSKLAIIYSAMLGVPESFFVLNKDVNVCEYCHGLGTVEELDVSKILDYNKPLKNNPFRCWQRYGDFYAKIISKFCMEKGIDIMKSFDELSAIEQDMILYGESEKKYQISYKHGAGRASRTTKYYGIMTKIPMRKNYEPPKRYYSDVVCPECGGKKFSKGHLQYKLNGISIGELMLIPFGELEIFLQRLEELAIDEKVKFLIASCIAFIKKANELKLKHLFLNRTIPTLSGGELQRLRLVQVFISQLSDLIIVLDEPLAGLSGIEKEVVYKNIMDLVKKHTLVIVDHSDLFVKNAKNIIALGEGGGRTGGELVDVKKYLDNQKVQLPLNKKGVEDIIYAKVKKEIYHYKGIDIAFATNRTNVVSGASGIGKTTLIKEYLPRFFEDYIYINQKQIVGNQNSNVATLLGISTYIYKFFANFFEKDKDYFSNMSGKEGACPVCNGAGYIEYGNNRLECGECNGSGFNNRVKKQKINGISIYDVWNMTIDEAIGYFDTIEEKIVKILYRAQYLALGHLMIGQSTETLSGGENIRIKLMKLDGIKSTVIGIDEPFKGLNPAEIYKIMQYLIELRDRGKTIIVVDHTDVVKNFFDKQISIGVKNGEIIENV